MPPGGKCTGGEFPFGGLTRIMLVLKRGTLSPGDTVPGTAVKKNKTGLPAILPNIEGVDNPAVPK